MDYMLLKQIVPNRFYLPPTFSAHPTNYPGFDCVNPGIGNIASPYSFFVASHFMSNPNLRKKLVPSQEHSVVDKSAQEGNGAQEENADVTINNINENKIANTIENKKKVGGNGNSDDDEKILNSLNEHKRKLLDASIYESFVHPKKIKTETLSLNLPKSSKIKVAPTKIQLKTSGSNELKTLKHKFKFE